MDRRGLLAAGAMLPLLTVRPAFARGKPYRQVRIPAPFDMPAIEVPDFWHARRFPITDFGAVPDDQRRTANVDGLHID